MNIDHPSIMHQPQDQKRQPWKANWPPAAEQASEMKAGFGFAKGEQMVLDGAGRLPGGATQPGVDVTVEKRVPLPKALENTGSVVVLIVIASVVLTFVLTLVYNLVFRRQAWHVGRQSPMSNIIA